MCKEEKTRRKGSKMTPWRLPGASSTRTLELQSYPNIQNLGSLCAKKKFQNDPMEAPWGCQVPHTQELQSYPQHTKFWVPMCKIMETKEKVPK